MRASLLVYIPHSISCLGDDGDRILRSCPCTLRFLEVCCRLRQIFHFWDVFWLLLLLLLQYLRHGCLVLDQVLDFVGLLVEIG